MNRIVLLGLLTLAAFADTCCAELCLPGQWQGFSHIKSLQLKPHPLFQENTMHLFSDAINLKQAVFVNLMIHGQVKMRYFLVSLFDKSGRGVTIYDLNLETNRCAKTISPDITFVKTCLPDVAINLGSSFVGIEGLGGVKVTKYGYQLHKGKTVQSVINVGRYMIPVQMTTYDGTENTFSDVDYRNYTIGIQNPAIFDIPKQCQQGVVEHQEDSPLAKELLQRFTFSKPF